MTRDSWNRRSKSIRLAQEMARRGGLFFLAVLVVLVLVVALVPFVHAQRIAVDQMPGSTVGTKLSNAQNLGCSPDTTVTCVLVLEPILSVFPEGSLPARCARCVWFDYRSSTTGPVFSPGVGGVSSSHFGDAFSSTMYYLNQTSRADTLSVRKSYANTLTTGFYHGLRSEITAASGGEYAGTQTAYVPLNGSVIMQAKGQAVSAFGYVKALGIGNGIFANSIVQCWGGSADVSPGSVPQCGYGEHNVFVGSQTDGETTFKATISGTPTATQLSYSGEVNEGSLGQRYLLNTNRTYTTGTVASVTGSTINGSGTTWTSGMTGKYIKIGSTAEWYAPACSGNDVQFDSKCTGHWYKIKTVPSGTQLTVEAQYDTVELATSGAYVIMDGVEVTGFDSTANTITYASNSYTTSWVAGDTIVSPPNHLMGCCGPIFIFNRPFKSGRTTVNAFEGMRFTNSTTQPLDTLFHIQGPFKTLYRAESFSAGTQGFDFSTTNFSDFVVKIAQGDKIKWGVGPRSLHEDGTGMVFTTANAASGIRSVRFIDGTGNSALDIIHPASGVVSFRNQAGVDWFQQAGSNGAVNALLLDILNQDVRVLRPAANTIALQAGGNNNWTVTNAGISSTGAFKHQRVTTGSCATTGCSVTLTWTAAFADANYTATCDVEDATAQSETTGLRLARITSKIAASVTVAIDNFSGAGVTGTLGCVAYHD